MKHEPITLQMIFDLAWQKFIVEGGDPAANAESTCMYLTEDGRKCAVGLALPDRHEAQGCGQNFNYLVEVYPELFAPEVVDMMVSDSYQPPGEALTQFQIQLHDGLQKGGKWIESLEERTRVYRSVAEEYGLTVPTVD